MIYERKTYHGGVNVETVEINITTADAELKPDKQFSIENTNHLLQLMNIYLSEWEHRDKHFWSQAFAYFMASLSVSSIPFIGTWAQGPLFGSIPLYAFPVTGGILAFVFIIIMRSYYERSKESHDAYMLLIKQISPESFREKLITERPDTIPNRIYKKSISKWGVRVMFVALITIAILSGLFVKNSYSRGNGDEAPTSKSIIHLEINR